MALPQSRRGRGINLKWKYVLHLPYDAADGDADPAASIDGQAKMRQAIYAGTNLWSCDSTDNRGEAWPAA